MLTAKKMEKSSRLNVKIKRTQINDFIEEIRVSKELLAMALPDKRPVSGRTKYSNSPPVKEARLDKTNKRDSNSPKSTSAHSVQGKQQEEKTPLPNSKVTPQKNLVMRLERIALTQEVVPSLPEKRIRCVNKKNSCDSTCTVCSNLSPKRRKTNSGYKSSPSKTPNAEQTMPFHEMASTSLGKCAANNKSQGCVQPVEESTNQAVLQRERSKKRKSAPVKESKSVKLKRAASTRDIHLSGASSQSSRTGGAPSQQALNYCKSQSLKIMAEGTGIFRQSFILPLGFAELQKFAMSEKAGATPVSAVINKKTNGSQIPEQCPESPDLPETNITASYVGAGKNRKLVITPPEEYVRITESGLLLCANVVKNCALELMKKSHKDIFLCVKQIKSENSSTVGKEYYKVTFDDGALKFTPTNVSFETAESSNAAERSIRGSNKKSSCLNTVNKELLAPKNLSEQFLEMKDCLKASVPETIEQEELSVTPTTAETYNSSVSEPGDSSADALPIESGSPSGENLYQDSDVAEPQIQSIYSISLEEHELQEAAVNVNPVECTMVETTPTQALKVAIVDEFKEAVVNLNSQECTLMKNNPPQESVLPEQFVNALTEKSGVLKVTTDEHTHAVCTAQEETGGEPKIISFYSISFDQGEGGEAQCVLQEHFLDQTSVESHGKQGLVGEENVNSVSQEIRPTSSSAMDESGTSPLSSPSMFCQIVIEKNSNAILQEGTTASQVVEQDSKFVTQGCSTASQVLEQDSKSVTQECSTASQVIEQDSKSVTQGCSTASQVVEQDSKSVTQGCSTASQVVEQDSNDVTEECSTALLEQNLVEPEMTRGYSVCLGQLPLISHPVQTRRQKPAFAEPGSSYAYQYSAEGQSGAAMHFSPEHDGKGSKAMNITAKHKYHTVAVGRDSDRKLTLTDLQVAQWNIQNTQLWFASHGLGCFLKDFSDLDGASLMEMVHCLNTQSQLLHSSLKEMGYKLPEILRLFAKLRTLPCRISQ